MMHVSRGGLRTTHVNHHSEMEAETQGGNSKEGWIRRRKDGGGYRQTRR